MVGHQKYQATQVEGAGPLGLVLLTYDVLYKSLAQAKAAILANNLQAETEHTARALEAIIELSSSLDMEQGGEVATNLALLYNYLSQRLTENMCTYSTQAIDEGMLLIQSLREGWQALEQQQNPSVQQHSHLQAYAA